MLMNKKGGLFMNENKLFNALQNEKELKFTFKNQELEKLEEAIFTKENLKEVETKVTSNLLYEDTDLYNFIKKNTNILDNNRPLELNLLSAALSKWLDNTQDSNDTKSTRKTVLLLNLLTIIIL